MKRTTTPRPRELASVTRKHSPLALDLLERRLAADRAQDLMWVRALEALDDGMPASAVASILRVSVPVLLKKVDPWRKHRDAGPGVGR